jgi:hypothetical protein
LVRCQLASLLEGKVKLENVFLPSRSLMRIKGSHKKGKTIQKRNLETQSWCTEKLNLVTSF